MQEMTQSRITAFPRHLKRRRDEEQIMTKQIPNMKSPTHKERITVTEEMFWNGGTLNDVIETRCLFKNQKTVTRLQWLTE